jgi:hypothetical protein
MVAIDGLASLLRAIAVAAAIGIVDAGRVVAALLVGLADIAARTTA